jgi:hypothetical protein
VGVPLDLPLLLTILVIFLTSVLATILQRRSRDVCLKKFHQDLVYCQLRNGKWVWGTLHVYSKSLEFVYPATHHDSEGHTEVSYIMFEDVLPQIQLIVRPLPPENTEEYHAWRKELDRVIKRTIWLTIRRPFRNIWNTLRDAFSQSIGLVVMQFRARNPVPLMAQADQKLTSTGQMLAMYGNNAYEPILEKYLGKSVVTEFLLNEKWIEQLGTLEEYSDKYLLLRNSLPHTALPMPSQVSTKKAVDIIFPRSAAVVRHLAQKE